MRCHRSASTLPGEEFRLNVGLVVETLNYSSIFFLLRGLIHNHALDFFNLEW